MKSADYWRQRSEAVEAQAHARAQASIALIEQWFLEAQREVQKEIESWYTRFAASEGLSLSDARKLLNSRELEEFRWTVEQYVKAGASGDPRWAKQLENASARFHVSRLEAVQLQMQQQLERLYGNQLDEMESLFRHVAGDTYTRTAFDLMQGIGVGWDITAPDEKVLDRILSTPWTTDNATFRDRCWTMKDELRAQLQKDLTQGLMTGKPPLEISKGIEKRFGVSRYKAARLVNTETTYFNAVSSQQCYKDLDVERFEVIVTLDDTTCEICGKMDGKILPMPQYEPGVTVPPYHPNCRCTTAPAIDPEFAGERAARAEDGKVYYVPSNMTYEEWQDRFVTGKSTDINSKQFLFRADTPIKPTNPIYDFEEITQEWVSNPITPAVRVDALTFERDGVRYTVHGKDVVLDHDNHEKAVADLLSSRLNCPVYLLPRVNKPEGIRSPDIFMSGKVYDMKTAKKTISKGPIFKRVKDGVPQAQNSIIDITFEHLSEDVIKREIERVYHSADTRSIDVVILVDDMEIRHIYRRKKR